MNNNGNGLTPAEEKQIEWCLSILNDDQLAELEEQAHDIAMKEVNAPLAAEMALPLLVKLKAREMRVKRK